MLNKKPNIPLVGVIVFAAGGIFYYFDGFGIMIFGIILAWLVGSSSSIGTGGSTPWSPTASGVRDSGDPEKEAAREAQWAQIQALGILFCIFGISYMVVLTYFFPSS